MEVLITLQKNVSIESEKKSKNLVRLVIKTTVRRNICLGIFFRCVSEDHLISKCPKPPKKNEKRQKQKNLMKKVIVHATTAKITVTKGYMHLWHACMVMTNVLVEMLVTVCN